MNIRISAKDARHLPLRECDNACLPDKDKGSAAPPPALLATFSAPARHARELRSRYFDMIPFHSPQLNPVNS
jgi:hypothetical protein